MGDSTFTAFDVDDYVLAIASTDGTATLVDLTGDVAELLMTIEAYNKLVDHVVFGPNDRLMTAAWNRPTKVWDVSG